MESRFEALKILNQEKIDTFIFFGPVLPYFSDTDESLSLFFQKAIDAKVKYIYIDKMNYTPSIWERLRKFLNINFPELLSGYQSIYNNNGFYAEELRTKIKKHFTNSSFELNLVF